MANREKRIQDNRSAREAWKESQDTHHSDHHSHDRSHEQDPSVNQEHQLWKEFQITLIDDDPEQPHTLEESPLRDSFQQNTGQMTPKEMNDLLNAAPGERSDAEVQAGKQQGMDALMKEIGASDPKQSLQSPETLQGRLADWNLNYTAPDAPQVPATTEGKQLSTPVDANQNFTPANFTPAEIKQSLNPELNQSVQTPELNQSLPLSGPGTPNEHSNTPESNAPIDSGNVNTPGTPDAGPEYQGSSDAGVPQSGVPDQPDMNVNNPIGPISIDPGSSGPISYDPGEIHPGQSDEPNASFEPDPPDMGAFIPTPDVDYRPDTSFDNSYSSLRPNEAFVENEGLGPTPIGIGTAESAVEGTLEPLAREIVAWGLEELAGDGVEAYKTWSENQSENEPEISPNAMSFDPGMSYDPGPMSDPDMPIELINTNEPNNNSEPNTPDAPQDVYTPGTPDAGPEYQENLDAGVPDGSDLGSDSPDASAPAVDQPFDPNMSIDPSQFESTNPSRSFDNNPSMDIPSELNQSIQPPEGNQSVAPPELNQSVDPPEGNQSVAPSELNQSIDPPEGNQSIQPPEVSQSFAPPELNQSVSPPELNQSVQPPELNQSIQSPELNQSVQLPELNQSIQPPEIKQGLAPPDSSSDAGNSSTEVYKSGSSNASGYDGGYSDASGYDAGSSDASGYDGGYSDAGGYDAGSSDAAEASEGGGEAEYNQG